jgi:hypothetical protein
MAHNIVEFWDYKEDVPASVQYTSLPKQPFGATIATGSAMTIEVMFTCSGYDGTSTYLGVEKWLLAARYSSTNNVSATGSHHIQTRIGYAGSVASNLDALEISVASGTPRLAWTPKVAGNRWTVRGHLWVVSAA